MNRGLIFSGLLCLIGLFLVLSFYASGPHVPQINSGATSYYYIATSNRAICTLRESSIERRIPTQRTATVWNLDFEILWIPESATKLTLSVDIQRRMPTFTLLEKTWTWTYTFPNSTQLPVRKIIPLTIYADNSDFDLPIGETQVGLKVDFHVDVIKSSGEIEPTYGQIFSGTRQATLVNGHPLIAFFTTNAFGIGLGLLSVGIVIATVVVANLAIKKTRARAPP
jgi:hypothetical protein